jgi:hypothetical protein
MNHYKITLGEDGERDNMNATKWLCESRLLDPEYASKLKGIFQSGGLKVAIACWNLKTINHKA